MRREARKRGQTDRSALAFGRAAVLFAFAQGATMLMASSATAQSVAPAEQVHISYAANTESSVFSDGWTPDLNHVVGKLFSVWSGFYAACSAVSTTGARPFVDKGWSVNGKWASRNWTSTVGLVKGPGCGNPQGPDYPARTWEFPIMKWESYGCASGNIEAPVVTDMPLCISSAPPCPVAPLQPITDPVAKEHESGNYRRNADLEHVTPRLKSGALCILQKSVALNPSVYVASGYRPPTYQAHLREVWDKWQLLKGDSTEACRAIKAEVQVHWKEHGLVRRPVLNSNHSSGDAVDFGLVPPDQADQIAKECSMFRPEPVGDPVHFQPR
jgi:hypothetical protein